MLSKLVPKRNKLVVIGGPTATGKTALAMRIAKEVEGEVVSADARQIYRGMDVGTGKGLPVKAKVTHPSPRLRRVPLEALAKWGKNQKYKVGYYEIGGVKVWLYDVVAPDQRFSAADYRRVAWPVVEDIWRRGKLPLVVGGTGFYIKALLRGFGGEGIPPDWELRKQLDGWTAARLAERLKRVAPGRWERMNESDRQNPRRLIRAIEMVASDQGLGFNEEGKNEKKLAPEPYTLVPLFIGLFAPYPYLYRRIDARVEEMMGKGLLTEVEKLVQHYGWTALGLDGLGYRQFKPCFEGQSTLADCVQRIKYETHAYARRQMTWFKRELDIVWFDVSQPGFDEQVIKLVKSFR